MPMPNRNSTFDDRPGISLIVGPALPNPKAEITQAIAVGPSLTAVLAFQEVLKRFPLKPLRRPARRLRSPAELRHDEFLSRLVTDMVNPLVSPATVEQARAVWEATRRAAEIPVPAASVGVGGTILYAWDSGEHHVEVEIGEGQLAEWMYVNRQTGETWFASRDAAASLSTDLLAKVRLFA
jgi:hypothetical protein